MKPIITALVLVLVCSSCTNDAGSNDETRDTTAVAPAAEPLSPEAQMVTAAFPNMYQFLKGQDPSFDPAFFEETEGGYNAPPPPRFFPPEELNAFIPYLIYNRDSTRAIDLVSYNYVLDNKNGKQVLAEAGPDTEVGIIDLNENMRTRIFYSGPGTTIREGKWLDSTTVLLGGAESISSSAIRPFILRINLKEKTQQRFTYTDSVQAKL